MGLASVRPPQAAFKSAPGRFVTRITYYSKLIGILSLAAFLQLKLFGLYRHAIICCKWKFDGSISRYFWVYLAALAQK
ncbi:hypothetical protein DXZ79_08710 [Yersinia rochesterensis]|uniref:Uncharacterized protein n=1 Tax=Yersinia rochesterensis TaxID=1604335 RepID=A0A8D4SRP5_9GAMM|nr:hypothetical protein DXZ79_08710 [Yersinia rochesterensis]